MTDLVVENVHKTLGSVKVLKDASLTGARGKVVALLGASGSGKTTLLRCIAGLEIPEGGRIVIGGQTVFDAATRTVVPPEKRNIGLVFQSYALWPHKTVLENVAFGLQLRGVSKADTEARVRQTLDKLGLGHLGERYPFQLSGGQQQRVAICRALVYEPKVILLDEPLSNLDAKLREEARFWIRKLILDLELCAVVVTHDQGEALAMSDRVLLLKDGAIVQEGAPIEIYSRPTNRYTAEFLGANNVVSGIFGADAHASLKVGNVELQGVTPDGKPPAAGQPAAAIIRVERLKIAMEAGSNRIPMQVDASIYLGDHWEHRLSHGALTLRARGQDALPAGEVWCECPPEHVWIFAS